jgi:hypothetical protein
LTIADLEGNENMLRFRHARQPLFCFTAVVVRSPLPTQLLDFVDISVSAEAEANYSKTRRDSARVFSAVIDVLW